MKYKLIESSFDARNKHFADKVLFNKGIENPEQYKKLTDSALNDYLGLSNIDKAVNRLLGHIEKNSKILLIVDSDVDGYCSSAILYRYLVDNYTSINLIWKNHPKKEHGLGQVAVEEGVNLVILPDSGSNDVDECRELLDRGIQVIILDHHPIEKLNDCAIVVNPYLNSYPNKYLSGTAVVYKFLEALADQIWGESPEKFLDLVALSIISDSMDLHEVENKRLVDKGLQNINNNFFKSLIEKQDYSMRGQLNIQNIQFYIVPLINGLIRSGSQDEKEMMFRAFYGSNESFDYKKRSGEIVKESICDRVSRLATNAKAKQNREIDSVLAKIIPQIEKYNWDKNKILFVNSEGVDTSFTGLIAMKLASKYNKPCIFLRELGWKPGYMGGSMRNPDGSPIENFKQFLLDTDLFDMVQGHNNAAGVNLETLKLRDIIAKTNEYLKDMDFTKIWKIDFVFNYPHEVTEAFVKEMDSLKSVGIGDGLFLVKNVRLNTKKDISLMGKEDSDRRHWTFNIDAGDDDSYDPFSDTQKIIKVIRFNKEDEQDNILDLLKDDWDMEGKNITINMICRADMNKYNDIVYPNLYILDYEIVV